MGFNYGYEKKKFDSRWKRLEVEYPWMTSNLPSYLFPRSRLRFISLW